MKLVLAIFEFLGGLTRFIPWFTKRKDERQEIANKTKAAITYEKNASDIDNLYRK